MHVGTHRTGTTSFQRWALANRVELARATGLQYYDGLFGPNHCELPMMCLRADRSMPMRALVPDWCLDEWQSTARAHIRAQATRARGPLFVSAEGLSYVRHADEANRLVELLRPRRVSVVVVLRERSSFLDSYRQALADAGFDASPYRESFANVADDSWLVDYDALLAVYRDALGTEHVATIDYEQALHRDGSIIPGLLTASGFDASQLPPWKGFRYNATRARRWGLLLPGRSRQVTRGARNPLNRR